MNRSSLNAIASATPIGEQITQERDRAADLEAQLAAAGAAFVAAVDALVPLAGELARLDHELLAVNTRLGRRRRGPSADVAAVDVLCGRLTALRPSIPFASSAAADAAADLLCRRERLTTEAMRNV